MRNRRNWKKVVIALGILLSAVAWKTQVTEAKEVPVNKPYEVDLNGDGKKETVKFSCKTNDDDWSTTAKLSINGKNVYSKTEKSAVDAKVNILDFNSKDKKKDICICFFVENQGLICGEDWQYTGKKLKKSFQFSRKDMNCFRMNFQEKQPGNGTVYVKEEYYDPVVQQGHVLAVYQIKSGRLKPVKGKILNTTKEWRKSTYTATKKLSVYDRIGASKKKFTIQPGTVFYIQKIKFKKTYAVEDGITNFYVKTKNGKTGWVTAPKEKFVKELYVWG